MDINLPEWLIEELKDQAKRENTTVDELVHRVVEVYVGEQIIKRMDLA